MIVRVISARVVAILLVAAVSARRYVNNLLLAGAFVLVRKWRLLLSSLARVTLQFVRGPGLAFTDV